MTKRIMIVAIVLLLGSIVLNVVQRTQNIKLNERLNKTIVAEVLKPGVTLRTKPKGKILGLIPPGTKVEVASGYDKHVITYYNVKYNGKTGVVWSKKLKFK